MTAQIRPNRMEVSDRFPMLGFSVRVDEPNVEAEVVLANDISLFDPQNKDRRNASNFYTSRENGTLMVPRGDGVFVVAPTVLARFVGSDKLYFGLATGRTGNGGLKVDALPREGSPYVSLRGFTGRSLRRNFGNGRHAVPPRFEWTGDMPRPGSQGATPASRAAPAGTSAPAGNGAATGAEPAAPNSKAARNGEYDDGFGPMPAIPARESAYRAPAAARRSPSQMGIMLSSGTTARDALNWIIGKVEQAVGAVGSDVDPPVLFHLGANSSTFITAWETAFRLTGFIVPVHAFLAELPKLSRETGVTLSIGPALDTPLFGGGVGVVFGPDGQVALFGTGEISADLSSLSEFASSLKLALQAKMKLGYNGGGIAGFADVSKVAAINVGEELVVGAELWLDRSGNGIGGAVSIGVGLALQLAADKEGTAGATPRQPTPRLAPRAVHAAAMVVGLEDRQKVRRYARDFIDIFQWTVPTSVVNEIAERGFSIQTIDAAVGDLNLDFYKIDITRFPSGWDGPKFLNHFMRHINDFLDTDNTEFIPYADSDVQRLGSANPLGTVFKLDIMGPDNAAVVISDVKPQYFAVSTIHTPDTGDHPVSGHRMFGYANEPGKTVFFTRAADRPTLLPQGFQQLIFKGAEALWESMQQKVAAFINDNGGAATIVEPFSERFNPTAVREEIGRFDVAQGLAAESAGTAIVRPVLPNDQRARAARIGGPFAGRVGEALDLGVESNVIDALLNTLDPPATAQPMNAGRGRPLAKLQSATRSINWDDIELIPQPTDQTCWAAAAAMIIGWRDQVSLTPETVAAICSRSTVAGLSPYDRETFASQIGLQTEPPQSYSGDGFYDLLTTRGPLWVSKIAGGGATGGHAVVVTGMYSEGEQHYVRIADPWDRVVGTPGAPGGYASTHSTGSRYIMRYEDFQTEYELRIVGDPPTPQILHSGDTAGRQPNTGTAAAPQGYAMAVPSRRGAAPAARASATRPPATRAFDAGAIATIAGTAVTLLAGNSGDIAWQLPQWTGRKHPNDTAPATEAPFLPGVIALTGWPTAGGTSANCLIRWFYNGTSIGPVYVERGAANDTVGWGLLTTGTIEDDPRLHPRSPLALAPGPQQVPALHVMLTYEFHAPPLTDDPTATSRITLYADGTHEIDNEWIQRSGDGPLEKLSQPDARDAARTNSPVFLG